MCCFHSPLVLVYCTLLPFVRDQQKEKQYVDAEIWVVGCEKGQKIKILDSQHALPWSYIGTWFGLQQQSRAVGGRENLEAGANIYPRPSSSKRFYLYTIYC